MTPATQITELKNNSVIMGNELTRLHSKTTLIEELCREFDLQPEQIFVTKQGDLFFDYEALCVLANALGTFPDISVEAIETNKDGLITAQASVMLESGHIRRSFDTVLVGDIKPDGSKILDFREAVSLVRARALRGALRAAGFDPVKAYNKSKNGEQPELEIGYENTWQKMNSEAHAIGQKLGYIIKHPGVPQLDKLKWYRLMRNIFPNVQTSKDLSEVQMSQWLNTLRGLDRATNPY